MTQGGLTLVLQILWIIVAVLVIVFLIYLIIVLYDLKRAINDLNLLIKDLNKEVPRAVESINESAATHITITVNLLLFCIQLIMF